LGVKNEKEVTEGDALSLSSEPCNGGEEVEEIEGIRKFSEGWSERFSRKVPRRFTSWQLLVVLELELVS